MKKILIIIVALTLIGISIFLLWYFRCSVFRKFLVCNELANSNESLEFTSPQLSGFSMSYNNDWTVTLKEFQQPDTVNFKSTTRVIGSPGCDGGCCNGCMGVRFSKNETNLDLVFQLANDDNTLICTNQIYKEIDGIWYRVETSNGYFYTVNQSVTTNKLIGPQGEGSGYVEVDGNGYFGNGEIFNICVGGKGQFLQDSPLESFWGKEIAESGAILLEHPRVYGSPDEETLNEIDAMITSIKGLMD